MPVPVRHHHLLLVALLVAAAAAIVTFARIPGGGVDLGLIRVEPARAWAQELPAGFGEPPGARVTHRFGGWLWGEGTRTDLILGGSVDDLVGYYRDQLQKSGFQIDGIDYGETGTSIHFSRDGGRVEGTLWVLEWGSPISTLTIGPGAGPNLGVGG